MRSSVIIFTCTIIPISLLAIAAYRRYRKRLDQAVSEDSTASERQHREASPAEFMPWLLIALLVIWNAVTVGKVSAISSQLDILNNNLNNRMMGLSSQIDELEKLIQNESSILQSWDWEFGAFDAKSHRVAVNFTFVPRSITENAEMSLEYGGQTVPCTREGSFYKASVMIDIFALIQDPPAVSVREGESLQMTIMTDVPVGYLWSLYLPYYDSGANDLKVNYKKGTLTVSGELIISQAGKGQIRKDTKAELIKEVGGTILERVPISSGEDVMQTLPINDRFDNASESSEVRYLIRTEAEGGYSVQTLAVTVTAEGAVQHHGYVEILNAQGERMYIFEE